MALNTMVDTSLYPLKWHYTKILRNVRLQWLEQTQNGFMLRNAIEKRCSYTDDATQLEMNLYYYNRNGIYKCPRCEQ